MTDMKPQPPAALRAIIWDDLRPVSPLWAPWQRALLTAPLAVVAMIAVVRAFGLRDDAVNVGPYLSWGASTVQAILGVVLVGLAMREAVPGRALPARSIVSALLGGVGLMMAVTLVTYVASPTFARAFWMPRFLWICFRDAFIVGAPVVLLSSFLVARARPLRPVIAGLLFGAGGGLIGDAAWRLFCDLSDPTHVLAAHGLAALANMCVGALLAVAVEKLRGRT